MSATGIYNRWKFGAAILKNSRYMTNYLISRWQPAAMWALCENHKYSNLGAFAAPFSTCLSVFKHHPSSGYNSAPRLMTLSSPRPIQGHRRPKLKVAFAGGWLPVHPAIGPHINHVPICHCFHTMPKSNDRWRRQTTDIGVEICDGTLSVLSRKNIVVH